MNEDIKNFDENGNWHGYQQRYWSNNLWYRGKWKNHYPIGYLEDHHVKLTKFYI